MRNTCPIAYVPELDATLITKHKDIKENEKNVQVFSSWQPQGLMTQLMGENLMRKDGRAHMQERKAIYPTMSPKAVQTIWREQFTNHSQTVIQQLTDMNQGDLFWKYAMPVSALSLCSITGLTNMSPEEMNRVSQGMIDGCANYAGDPSIEDTCKDCTASIDQHIDEKLDEVLNNPNASLLCVQRINLSHQS